MQDFWARAARGTGERRGGRAAGDIGGAERRRGAAGEGGEGQPAAGEGGAGERGTSPGAGDAPGDTPDTGPTLGESTDLASRRDDQRAAGVEGEGPSRSEIIFQAAQKGFATARYRDVVHDYETIVEEDMEREELPPGYRRYVEEYFDLIREPR
jgi:hypothetical protein